MRTYTTRHAFYTGAIQPSDPTSTSSQSHTFQTIDPSTQQPLATIHTTHPSQIDQAIQSAKIAFPKWSTTPPPERSRVLLRAASLLRQRNDLLATVETHDTGKPFSETSTVDIATGADVLEYYAHLVASGGLNGESFPLRSPSSPNDSSSGNAWVYTTKEPLGVCVGIGAWNYPLQIALWKSGPCLAAGNTMVYKPSEVTPLHAQLLAEIYTEAGLPPGVFNIVYGDGEVGAYLTSHPEIAKVSFTGQVATGRKVASAAAGGMKSVTMELGGKSPLIVLPDADIDSAVDGAMMANFFSSGQVCTNGTRVFVPRATKGEFERLLVRKMELVRSGDLMDMKTNFGPLVSKVHYEKVLGFVKHGLEVDKARLLYGGIEKPKDLPKSLQAGLWITPTVFTDCTDNMKIVKEEIFGPVMTILTYDTIEEAVGRANDTELGLAAGVFGKDINVCHSVVKSLHAGITWINTWGESPAEMAVGGWKQSGVGVENGRRGLEAWLRNKSTLIEMGGSVPTVFAKL